jgi:hypothetical protein
MHVTWDYAAQVFLDQLAPSQKAAVERAMSRLGSQFDELKGDLKPLVGFHEQPGEQYYSLGVDRDLRVILRYSKEAIRVMDIVPRRQIERLRSVGA